MTRAEWEHAAAQKAQRTLDRRRLEAGFNAEMGQKAQLNGNVR